MRRRTVLLLTGIVGGESEEPTAEDDAWTALVDEARTRLKEPR